MNSNNFKPGDIVKLEGKSDCIICYYVPPRFLMSLLGVGEETKEFENGTIGLIIEKDRDQEKLHNNGNYWIVLIKEAKYSVSKYFLEKIKNV